MPQPARPRATAGAASSGRGVADVEMHQGHQEQCRREEADRGIALDGAAPADPGHDERHRRGDGDLPEVAREVIGAERHPPRPGLVGLRHERGGQRVLDAGAEPGQHQAGEQRGEAAREPGGEESEGGDRGARGEEPRLAPALREDPRGDLKGGHAPAVHRPEQAHLAVGQAELRGPDREQEIDDVGEAVVHEVDGGGGGEHRAGASARGGPLPRRNRGGQPGRASRALTPGVSPPEVRRGAPRRSPPRSSGYLAASDSGRAAGPLRASAHREGDCFTEITPRAMRSPSAAARWRSAGAGRHDRGRAGAGRAAPRAR